MRKVEFSERVEGGLFVAMICGSVALLIQIVNITNY